MVRADVVRMDSFSAHGDKKEMLDFISNQRGHVEKLMLVHGEYDTQKAFKSELRHNGFDHIIIPEMNELVWL